MNSGIDKLLGTIRDGARFKDQLAIDESKEKGSASISLTESQPHGFDCTSKWPGRERLCPEAFSLELPLKLEEASKNRYFMSLQKNRSKKIFGVIVVPMQSSSVGNIAQR